MSESNREQRGASVETASSARTVKRRGPTKIAVSWRRRLKMYAREPSVMGAVLVLGIIAALATHLVLGARQLLGDHRDQQQMALSTRLSIRQVKRPAPQPKRPEELTPPSDARSSEERTALLRAVGGALLSTLENETGDYVSLWRNLLPTDAPGKRGRRITSPRRRATWPTGQPSRAGTVAHRPAAPPGNPADPSVNGPVAQAMLKAILRKSYTLNFQKHSYERSYSLKHLHDSGALEDNLAGYRKLIDLAYGTDHAPHVLLPLYDASPTKWIDAEVAAVRSAQRYLREYGSRLVLQGLLDP